MDGGDVGVVDGRGGAGLGQETVARLGIEIEQRREKLERDGPLEGVVVGEIDRAHPTPAEKTLDTVAADALADPGIRTIGYGRFVVRDEMAVQEGELVGVGGQVTLHGGSQLVVALARSVEIRAALGRRTLEGLMKDVLDSS